MRRLPVQIATPAAVADITEEIKKLLRASNVNDQLPTPKEQILACSQLIETGELELADYEATIANRLGSIFHKAISKVVGFLERRSQISYVDSSIPDTRKLFVTYHEVTHRILPWQQIDYTEEDDLTLRPDCKEYFESEANYGAAELLFQCKRFENEARDYALSIESALYLANRYEASCHSSLRRFVERNHRACLLLVLKPTSREYSDGKTSYYVVYSIPSAEFLGQFGEALDMKFINPHEALGRILNNSGHGEIVLTDLKGFEKECVVESFSNSFRMFALIYPKQGRPSRITVRFSI